MNASVGFVNGVAEQWAHGMWPVLWQSALLALVVALATLILRRLPAAVRFWLWMLVPLRLMAMPLLTVSLPILPSEPVGAASPSAMAAVEAPPGSVTAEAPADMQPPDRQRRLLNPSPPHRSQ